MEDLTFGEQVKIILSRKGMTIKELAEMIQEHTGNPMSRQNLTQRLRRDNFQEQDMRMISAILGCPFHLSIFPAENASGEQTETMEEVLLKYVKNPRVQTKRKKKEPEDGVYQQVLVFEEEPEEKKSEEKPAEKTEKQPAAVQAGEKQENKAEQSDENTIDLEELLILDAEDSEDLQESESLEQSEKQAPAPAASPAGSRPERIEEERDITIGELYEIHEELNELEDAKVREYNQKKKESLGSLSYQDAETVNRDGVRTGGASMKNGIKHMPPVPDPATIGKTERELREAGVEDFEPVIQYEDAPEDLSLGEMNPYTGREYQTNSVRMHPYRIGYVQVYDRAQHGWTDMTEWAFLGYQERKKALLGRDYEPPIYLD